MKKTCRRQSKKTPRELSIKQPEVPEWDFGHRRRNFRRVTDVIAMREALRTKIDCLYREEYKEMFRIDNLNNQRDIDAIEAFPKNVQPIITKVQDDELRNAMAQLERLQINYEETTTLSKSAEKLKNNRIIINMRIIYSENELTRFTKLQNFLYTVKEPEWREVNDWIHRLPDGTLESYRESIQNRNTLFIRTRDNEDAFKVRDFYFAEFKPINHSVVIPFTNTDEFLNLYDYQKNRIYRALLELHLTMWLSAETQQKFQRFQDASNRSLKLKKKIVDRRCENMRFTESRIKDLKKKYTEAETKLLNAIKTRMMTAIEPVTDMILSKSIAKKHELDVIKNLPLLDKVSRLESLVFDLLHTLDDIPPTIVYKIEDKLRHERTIELLRANRALNEQKQIEGVLTSLKKNMEPPFKKLPREKGRVRLVRSRLPKINQPRPPPVPTFTEKAFIEAFTDDEVNKIDLRAKSSRKFLTDIERSCMPFYYDYFLERNFGYRAPKDIVTEIEQRDGKEEDRFQCTEVLPIVEQRLQEWERKQALIKQYNISQTEHLYQIPK